MWRGVINKDTKKCVKLVISKELQIVTIGKSIGQFTRRLEFLFLLPATVLSQGAGGMILLKTERSLVGESVRTLKR